MIDINDLLPCWEEDARNDGYAEPETLPLTLWIDSIGQRRLSDCISQRYGCAPALWSRTLALTPLDELILTVKFEVMEAIERALSIGDTRMQSSAITQAGLNVVKDTDGSYLLRTRSKYIFSTYETLWQAKYAQAMLSHPTVSSNYSVTDVNSINHVSINRLIGLASNDIFPVLRMFPLQYRCFSRRRLAS